MSNLADGETKGDSFTKAINADAEARAWEAEHAADRSPAVVAARRVISLQRAIIALLRSQVACRGIESCPLGDHDCDHYAG